MGILNYIKTVFGSSEQPPGDEKQKITTEQIRVTYDNIILAAWRERTATNNRSWWSVSVKELKVYTEKVLPLTHKQKAAFIIKACLEIHSFHKGRSSYGSNDKEWKYIQLGEAFQRQLLRGRLVLDDDDLAAIFDSFDAFNRYSIDEIMHWPVNLLIGQVEKQLKERPLSAPLSTLLTRMRKRLEQSNNNVSFLKEITKLQQRIDTMLFEGNDVNQDHVQPTFFPGEDEFARYANQTIRDLPDNNRQQWFSMMQYARKATGSKPSKKFSDEFKELIKSYGADKYKQQVNEWFAFLAAMKEQVHSSVEQIGGREYNFQTVLFLSSPNVDILKGFIWSFSQFYDKSSLFNIAQLANRAYKKIPGQGPTAPAIGNACVYALANSRGMDGLGHLSRLRLRVQHSSTQNLIEKYLLEAAAKQGVSLHEIEDMAVDDYGLQDGKSVFEMEGYRAELSIISAGKTSLEWFKPDGSPQKAVPAVIKEKHAGRLKKIKETVKQVELTSSAQRDRLDRMFKSSRTIPGSKFREYYFDHGLMSWLTRKTIWFVTQGENQQALFFHEGNWCNNAGEPVPVEMTDDCSFALWHPVFETVAAIKAWRDFMMARQIIQPLKQAFREVYILTDAELNTRTYSNRMAAHILKQHQFNSLAKIRGWKYSLMGFFDGGGNGYASLDLKEYGLTAQYWINEAGNEDNVNDTGIMTYVATDQLRFTDQASGNVKELIDIPAVLLSEVLRDLDLFVGVASVGNDPNWRDSAGLPGYNDYWQNYSFGDLNELAKTRRSILENLLPRLKIGKVAELKDKFLVVKGQLRTYKIHIGSTNILMEPNDQYLCIVADRGKKEMPGNVFLPFEGDTGLSVILSKAMMLAEDDKITDSTITSQINRQ